MKEMIDVFGDNLAKRLGIRWQSQMASLPSLSAFLPRSPPHFLPSSLSYVLQLAPGRTIKSFPAFSPNEPHDENLHVKPGFL